MAGEWGRTVTVVHGPLLPSVRWGSRRRISFRVHSEGGTSRIEAVLEQRMGDFYGLLGVAGAVMTPLVAGLSLIPGIVMGIASASLVFTSLLSHHIDVNWLSSLLEEACTDARDYQAGIGSELRCRIECEPQGRDVSCSLEPVDSPEVLAAALSILGFTVHGEHATNGSLYIRYRCEDGVRCSLVYSSKRFKPKPSIDTASLITLLAAHLVC